MDGIFVSTVLLGQPYYSDALVGIFRPSVQN